MKSAVLFLVFNRPDTTRQVFDAIRMAKPPRIYIAADGPRSERRGEMERCLETRQIANNVDWPCEVKTLFREDNLGCKWAVSSAITWFFEHEQEGIVLEDDCYPSLSFFRYCDELLERYRFDNRIWHISGNNFNQNIKSNDQSSYNFGGIYGSIWGWASWRNRWDKYDPEIKGYDKLKASGILQQCYDGGDAVKSRIIDFELIKNGLDTWDYQWVFCRWVNSGLTIIPSLNMIKNIGFGENATHTKNNEDSRAEMMALEIEFPLKHPSYVIRDALEERILYRSMYKKSLITEILSKIKIWIKIWVKK